MISVFTRLFVSINDYFSLLFYILLSLEHHPPVITYGSTLGTTGTSTVVPLPHPPVILRILRNLYFRVCVLLLFFIRLRNVFFLSPLPIRRVTPYLADRSVPTFLDLPNIPLRENPNNPIITYTQIFVLP